MADAGAITKLGKYLVGTPGDDGEWGMRCHLPQHKGDSHRSASVNFEKGVWHCQKCRKGLTVDQLLEDIDRVEDIEQESHKPSLPQPLDPAQAATFHKVLMKDKALIKKFQKKRGLSMQTMRDFEIGYDLMTHRYTIPIYDENGALVNIRKYNPDATRGDKMISVAGHGTPVLYPVQQLKNKGEVVICEGELDALTLIQAGFTAITRTGAAVVWLDEWSQHLFGRDVYICHDSDAPGQEANAKVATSLAGTARKVVVVDLGYPVGEKHGDDVTDFFWRDKKTALDFKRLMHESPAVSEAILSTNLRESINGENYSKLMAITGTVQTRRDQTWQVPKKVTVTCSQDWDEEVCPRCPMGQVPGGTKTVHIGKYTPEVRDYVFEQPGKIIKRIKAAQRLPKDCPLVDVETQDSYTVELLRLATPMDSTNVSDLNTTNFTREVYVVGSHQTEHGQTFEITGRIHPHPRDNTTEFIGLESKRVDTQIEKFQLTEDMLKSGMGWFHFIEGTAMERLEFLAEDLAANVTKIYGRRDMHIVMDLVWHSALQFYFDGELQPKGWLDVAVIGQTRTGKSIVAKRLNEFYNLGQVISCESASFAGLIGGKVQHGSSRTWETSWGVIPMNDRRLVVLDEASGLALATIGDLSDSRTSGIAGIYKVDSNQATFARVRLLWIGNPRHGEIYRGTQMLWDIFGNPEDISRLDLAMAVYNDDEGLEAINRPELRPLVTETFVDKETYRNLVMWAWTRKAEDITWESGAEAYVLNQSIKTGKTFVASPPLVESSSVRYKIARLAVAIACRLFSTYDGVQVVVTKDHVEAAVELMMRCYKNEKFAYYEDSQTQLKRREESVASYFETKAWLVPQVELCEFLREHLGRHITAPGIRDGIGVNFNVASGLMSDLRKKGLITEVPQTGEQAKPQNATPAITTPLLERMLREIPS